ncbi:hypothetical protein GEMRC1_008765 [Eukaryota sp. GEM-RC1]
MISIVNSSASFDNVWFRTIRVMSLIDAKTTELTFISCSFIEIYSFSILNLSESSLCSIDYSLVSNVITDVTFRFNYSTVNLINTEIFNANTQSFLVAAMSDIEVNTLIVHNSTTLDTFIKAVETGMRVEHLHLYYSTIFEVFQISESRVDLFSVEFGSTNDLSNSLFSISHGTVNAHSIDISGPFYTNISLITILGSTLNATQLNVDQLTSPLLFSYESFITFNDLLILSFNADSLMLINFSNSTFSNVSVSKFHSKSDTSTISVSSSTFSLNYLLLDQITSANFLIFNDSTGSISNSELKSINSSGSFIHLVSSSFRFENVTTVNADVTNVLKLDTSELYCQGVMISKTITSSVLISKDSVIVLSMFTLETSSVSHEFSVLRNSLMNSTSLSFAHCQLSALIQATNSKIELNSLEILISTFSNSANHYMFNTSSSQFLITNLYADVISIPIITSFDSDISLVHVEIFSVLSDVLLT